MTAELQATMLRHIEMIRRGMNDLYRSSHTGVLRLDSSAGSEGYKSLAELERLVREFKTT